MKSPRFRSGIRQNSLRIKWSFGEFHYSRLIADHWPPIVWVAFFGDSESFECWATESRLL